MNFLRLPLQKGREKKSNFGFIAPLQIYHILITDTHIILNGEILEKDE